MQAETALLATTYDYGDAPASYGVARHAPGCCSGALYIGPSQQDYESFPSVSSIPANGYVTNMAGYNDETNALDDYYVSNSSYAVNIPFLNNTGSASTFSAWIDWNANILFDSGEQAGRQWQPARALWHLHG